MTDSTWQDPFAEDEAARKREARRLEREARRRAEQESLGERVQAELSGPPAPPPHAAGAPPPVPPAAPQATEVPPPVPPPPPRRPRSETIRRRRIAALIGVGAAIVLVTGAGAVISQRDNDPAPPPAGERKTIEVVIPEGYDRSQVAEVTKDAGIKGDYEQATRASKAINLARYGAANAKSLEGFLFPATYELFANDDVEALVQKQLDTFESHLADIDLSYAESKNLSVYDVVIIASMIEREIAVPEERKLAASVIYNRLEANDTLGIDATIRFEDQNYTEPLVQSRLDTPTPYNTRLNPGLPPGPIGNPGLASLEAAANPAKTDFYYFVVKPGTCNEHTFVETETEFSAAEAKYQAALQEQGGSPTDC